MINQNQWSLVAVLSLMLAGVSSFAPTRNLQTRPPSFVQVFGRPSPPSEPMFAEMLTRLSSLAAHHQIKSSYQAQVNGRSTPPSWLVDAFTSSEPPNFDTKESSEEALLEKFEEDMAALSYIRPPKPSADQSIPTPSNAGSSYAMIWTKEMWNGHADPPHRRYPRHVRQWIKSSTFRKIMPGVICVGIWAVFVSTMTKKLTGLANVLNVSGTKHAFSYLSAPLALLLTLRANASMARLLEARQLWGRLVLNARGLSSILRTYLFPHNPEAAVLAVRHVATIGWLLKAQVRGEEESSQLDVLQVMLGDTANYQWMKSQSKRTVALTTRIRQICAAALSSLERSNYSPATHLIIEERICELETVVGACERLFGSPIPPTYTHHSSRVMTLWALLMPMTLVSAGLSTFGVAFATAVAAGIFIGLDEVGTEIENVFQLMPLQQLAGATQNDVREQFMASPPALLSSF